MKELGSAIINAMAGVVACAIAGCIILDIKWLVTSKRQMAKILRRQQLDLMAQPLQLSHQSLQTGDYAIDLGQPGVADNQHPHRTGSALVRASAAKLAWRA